MVVEARLPELPTTNGLPLSPTSLANVEEVDTSNPAGGWMLTPAVRLLAETEKEVLPEAVP